jgi:hypothetical protein
MGVKRSNTRKKLHRERERAARESTLTMLRPDDSFRRRHDAEMRRTLKGCDLANWRFGD